MHLVQVGDPITVRYIKCVLCIECVLYLVQVGGPITVKYRMSKETCGIELSADTTLAGLF